VEEMYVVGGDLTSPDVREAFEHLRRLPQLRKMTLLWRVFSASEDGVPPLIPSSLKTLDLTLARSPSTESLLQHRRPRRRRRGKRRRGLGSRARHQRQPRPRQVLLCSPFPQGTLL
jgi:hypothetical protein